MGVLGWMSTTCLYRGAWFEVGWSTFELSVLFALNRTWEPDVKRLQETLPPLQQKPERLVERIDAIFRLENPERHRYVQVDSRGTRSGS
jgi:hypothetical protein